jgi:hypothetical protein
MMRRLLTILGYLALTALVVGVTVLLVAYGNGIVYDFKKGKLIQTGIVIIQSAPNGIKVSVDGKTAKKKTPYRASFEAGGRHTFKMEKDGFYPWQKTLDVIYSEVSLVQYALLVPKHPATKVLDSRSNVVAQAVSKDNRHLAYVTNGADAAVYTMDLTNPKPVMLFAAPAATADKPAEALTGVAWSDDASHLIVTSKAGETAVHRVISANGNDVVNLTDQFRFDFTGLQFSSNDWHQLYWISPDGLRRVDLGNQSVSAVLADKVGQFKVIDGGKLLYVQATDLGKSLFSTDGHGHKQQIIAALPDSETYAIDFALYNSHEQVAVVPSRTQVGTLYSDAYSNNPVAKTIAKGVTSVTFSPDGHLVTFYAPGTVTTYDIQQSTLLNMFAAFTFQTNQLQSLSWYDSFHLLRNENGHLLWSEFDGANQVDLGTMSGGLTANSTPNLQNLVFFRPDGSLTRLTQLTIKP